MAGLAQINESSAGELTISFFDENGNSITPASVDYRIDCETNNQSILPWTTLGTPAAVMTVLLTSTQDAIINELNLFEVKIVSIRVDAGTPEEYYSQFSYKVNNLPFVP